jgi:hypothetical protein
VVNTFLNEPGWKVRAVTRDPSKASAKTLADKGAEIVRGDADDATSLIQAFEGAHAIFAVTDYWSPLFDPESQAKVRPGQNITQWAYDLEITRGKNIANASATIVGRPLEKFIWSALSKAKERSNGKYTRAYHFDSKAVITQYIYDAQPKLAKVTSIMQVGNYTSNCFKMPFFAPQKVCDLLSLSYIYANLYQQSDGVYELTLSVSESAKFPFTVVEKDVGAFAKVLTELPAGQRILAYNTMMSHNEFMRYFGKVNGVPVRMRQNTLEDWEQNFPGFGDVAAESYMYVEDFGYDGSDPTFTHPKDLKVKAQLSDIEQWMEAQDWTPLL